jgi:hypothetical protein
MEQANSPDKIFAFHNQPNRTYSLEVLGTHESASNVTKEYNTE